MSENHEETGLDCLFSEQAPKLNDIKFFRGSAEVIEVAHFKQELCASVDRSRANPSLLSREPPKCKKAPVDLKALVADM